MEPKAEPRLVAFNAEQVLEQLRSGELVFLYGVTVDNEIVLYDVKENPIKEVAHELEGDPLLQYKIAVYNCGCRDNKRCRRSGNRCKKSSANCSTSSNCN